MLKPRIKQTLAYAAFSGVVGAAAFWAGRATAPADTTETALAGPSRPGAGARPTTGRLAVNTGEVISLDDLLAAHGEPDEGQLERWAKGLSTTESATALGLLQQMPAGRQRDAALEAVVEAWAERDPQGFLSVTDQITVPRMREDGVQDALRTLASQDPKAALAWLDNNPGAASTFALRDRYLSIIEGFAAADPAGAMSTVAALNEDNPRDAQLKRQAFESIAEALADQGNFTGAVTMFADLPEGQLRNQTFNELTQRWAQSNPLEAAAWVQGLENPQERQRLAAQITQQWAQNDPAEAAKWAAQMDVLAASLPPETWDNQGGGGGRGAGPNNLLADAIRNWARYDLNAPANFLNDVPAGPTKDNAVATFAMRAGQEDPYAAQDWLGTIGNEQMRQNVAVVVAAQMLAQDPGNFQNFVSSSPYLSNQQKQQLQVAAANANPNQLNWLMGGGGGGGRGGGFENFVLNGGINQWLENGGQGGFGRGGGGGGGGGGQNFQGGNVNANANVNGNPAPNPQRGGRGNRGLAGGGQVQNGVQVYTPGTQQGNRRGRGN